jgi:glutathione S-transferase
MLTVHHLGVSQSDRIVWLCEELEIPYTLKIYQRDSKTRMAPPEYKALHPFGTAPVITDGDMVLGESGAIIEYIINRYGKGRFTVAPNSPNYSDYLFWFHFANASLMPASLIDVLTSMGAIPAGSDTAKSLRARGDKAFAMMEHRLGEASYFAGSDFTAADIIMLFPLTTMRNFAPRDLGPFPNIRAYLKRIGERPAYRRAMAKADPGMEPKLT